VFPFDEAVYAANGEDCGVDGSNDSGCPFCFNVWLVFFGVGVGVGVGRWVEESGLL